MLKTTDVIRRPLITEKTTVIRDDDRTIVFEVAMNANKIDIRRAVEKLLGSKVQSVRTSLAHGKMKRQGKYMGTPLGLEKGVREAAGRRKAARLPAGSVEHHADSQIQPDIARRQRQDVPDL
jgi:large subunit ribosomal protein L23